MLLTCIFIGYRLFFFFFFSSRRRHTRSLRDWSSDVCSSDLSRTRTWARIAMGAGALALLCASVATSHAVARVEDSGLLMIGTAMHALGAALWLGGLLCFRLALRRPETPQIEICIGRRYSAQAIAGVALIACGAIVFAVRYIGSLAAVYGTAYGAMAATKTVLLML